MYQLLKKSKFYMNGDLLREHIASYKDFAILLKQEQLKEEGKTKKESILFLTLIKIEELKNLKKVNSNKVRELQPMTISEPEKLMLLQKSVFEIDKL